MGRRWPCRLMKDGPAKTDTGEMDCPPASPSRILTKGDPARPGLLRRWANWFIAARSHRVLCMLAGLWLINLFDLMLTVMAHAQGVLDESNPIARRLLPLGPQALAVFKLVLVAGASAVLIRYRKRFISEVSAALMLTVYAGVAVRWKLCYDLYTAASGPIHSSELEFLNSWVSSVPIL